MKKIFYTVVLLIFAASSNSVAQTLLKSFSDKVSASRVTFSYDYSTKGNVPLKGKGNAVVQDDSFILKGDGLEVWCDGKSRWTMDPVAKEAVIEAVESTGRDYMTDPALLLTSAEDNFIETANEKVMIEGKQLTKVELKPKVTSDLKGLWLYFSNKIPVAADVSVKDGTVTHFNIRDLKFCSKSSGSEFKFDEASLDASWLVTDLR